MCIPKYGLLNMLIGKGVLEGPNRSHGFERSNNMIVDQLERNVLKSDSNYIVLVIIIIDVMCTCLQYLHRIRIIIKTL